jgi:hypothetical protein
VLCRLRIGQSAAEHRDVDASKIDHPDQTRTDEGIIVLGETTRPDCRAMWERRSMFLEGSRHQSYTESSRKGRLIYSHRRAPGEARQEFLAIPTIRSG